MSQISIRRALGLVAAVIAGIAIGLTVGALDQSPSVALGAGNLFAGPVAALSDDARELSSEVAPADTPFAVEQARPAGKSMQPRSRIQFAANG